MTAGIAEDKDGPPFRSAMGKTKPLTAQPLCRSDAWAIVRRRIQDAGLVGAYGCHSFRATGIPTFLKNEGNLETAQYPAGLADSRTAQIYDRRAQRITREDLQRIRDSLQRNNCPDGEIIL